MGIMYVLLFVSWGVMTGAIAHHKRLGATASFGFGILGAFIPIIGVLAVALVRRGPAREVPMV